MIPEIYVYSEFYSQCVYYLETVIWYYCTYEFVKIILRMRDCTRRFYVFAGFILVYSLFAYNFSYAVLFSRTHMTMMNEFNINEYHLKLAIV